MNLMMPPDIFSKKNKRKGSRSYYFSGLVPSMPVWKFLVSDYELLSHFGLDIPHIVGGFEASTFFMYGIPEVLFDWSESLIGCG